MLRDLVEKCPPAEACKDAFERMSKATVQVCMSTTGFGFDLKIGQQRGSNAPSRPVFDSMDTETSSPDPGVSQHPTTQQEERATTRRPPPKFDMELRDLFPDSVNHDDLASRSYTRQRQTQFSNQQNQTVQLQPQRPPRQYSFSQQQGSLNSQINAGLGINANHSSAGLMSQYFPQQQQQQQTVQQMQGNLPTTSQFHNEGSYGVDLTNVPGLDFLQLNEYSPDLDTNGLDLGFGPGMDFQHDWSDGAGVDMFDGFFFGNAAG